MNKKIASLIFIALILIIISVLFLVYKLASEVEVKEKDLTPYIKMESETSTQNLNPTSWMEKMAKQKDENFVLPANEISIKLDLSTEILNKYKYRVTINSADKYQFTLLEKFLKYNNFKYSYFKREKSVKVAILTNTRDGFETLINELDTYSIEYTIEKK